MIDQAKVTTAREKATTDPEKAMIVRVRATIARTGKPNAQPVIRQS